MSEKQTYRFEYEFIIDKIPKILGYNVPDFYSNIDNAKLEVALRSIGPRNKRKTNMI